VILTEITEYPTKRVLNVFCAAGNLGEIQVMIPVLHAWALEKGCHEAYFTGRAGWEKALQSTGWQTVARVYRKIL
jgi:hypothetical protein